MPDVGGPKNPYFDRLVEWDSFRLASQRNDLAEPSPGGAREGLTVGISRQPVSGLALNYVVKQHDAVVELHIDRGPGIDRKKFFDRLHTAKERIQKNLGGSLSWQRLDDKQACRIGFAIEGGYRDDEQQWTKTQEVMVDAMIRLERWAPSVKPSAHCPIKGKELSWTTD